MAPRESIGAMSRHPDPDAAEQGAPGRRARARGKLGFRAMRPLLLSAGLLASAACLAGIDPANFDTSVR